MTEVVTQGRRFQLHHNVTRAAAEVSVNDMLRGTGLTVKLACQKRWSWVTLDV
jgi:hypothetical protein